MLRVALCATLNKSFGSISAQSTVMVEILHLEKTEPEKVIVALRCDRKMPSLGFGARSRLTHWLHSRWMILGGVERPPKSSNGIRLEDVRRLKKVLWFLVFLGKWY